MVRTIANNFVSDHRPTEVMQIGLNSLREVFSRTPLVLEEDGMTDLIQDLVQYRKYRDNGVVMAARSMLNVVRTLYPAVLRRRDRGKEHDADARPMQFGAAVVRDTIDGTDGLTTEERDEDWDGPSEDEKAKGSGSDSDSWVDVGSDDEIEVGSSEDSEGEWEEASDSEEEGARDGKKRKAATAKAGSSKAARKRVRVQSEDEDDYSDEEEEEEVSEGEGAEESKDGVVEGSDDEDEGSDEEEVEVRPSKGKRARRDSTASAGSDAGAGAGSSGASVGSRASSGAMSTGAGPRVEAVRFLTPKDFERMAKKKVEDAAEAKGGKGKRNKITPADAARRLAANMEEVTEAPVVFVNPDDLQGSETLKRIKALERMQIAQAARNDKFKIKREGKSGLTNTEKVRTKNFLMLKKSTLVQAKVKRHLQQQQGIIRRHIAGKRTTDKRDLRKRRRV